MSALPRREAQLPAAVKAELADILTSHRKDGNRCICKSLNPRHGSHERHVVEVLTPMVAQFAAREVAAAHDRDSAMIQEVMSSLAGHTDSNLIAGTLEAVRRRIHQEKGRNLSAAGL